jgi:hypothetical protein
LADRELGMSVSPLLMDTPIFGKAQAAACRKRSATAAKARRRPT